MLLVTARRNFPYTPTMAEIPGTIVTENGVPKMRPFRIDVDEMVPRATHPVAGDEVVQPDVTRAMAEQEAKDRILRAVQPASALYAKYEPKVRAAAMCNYPLYVTRYGYEGHASVHGGSFHVVVSGRTGAIVGSRHPSALRSLARKFRRLMTPP